jgi:hypothetical protein
MATKKQIEANRRNAQKATGPRTPEGKAICCMNGLRNGLHSRGDTLPVESWQALLQIRERFMQLCPPQNDEQHRLVAQAACAEWKLLHWQQIHASLLRKAGEHESLRRQDRLRADFTRRQLHLERKLRQAFEQLMASIGPQLQPSHEWLPAA